MQPVAHEEQIFGSTIEEEENEEVQGLCGVVSP